MENVTQKRPQDPNRLALRKYVRIFYDLQRLRTQTGGRVRANKDQVELFEADKLALKAREEILHKQEKDSLKDVASCLKRFPFYTKVLKDKVRYRGIGPTMAGVILSEFDINIAVNPTQFWVFAGLAVVEAEDPKNPGQMIKRRQMLVKGQKSTFNTFLKSKLVGVLGDVLIKLKSPWTAYYYQKKNDLEQRGWGASLLHRHRASVRYMIKMLLVDIWRQWRKHEGLPLKPTYSEAKFGAHGYQGGPGADPYDWCKGWKAPEKAVIVDLEEEPEEVAGEIEQIEMAESL